MVGWWEVIQVVRDEGVLRRVCNAKCKTVGNWPDDGIVVNLWVSPSRGADRSLDLYCPRSRSFPEHVPEECRLILEIFVLAQE